MKNKYIDMNKLFYIFIVAVALFSCNKEESITAERGDNPYALKDSNDPVKHYFYDYAKKYSSIIRTEYEESEYVWNLTGNNDYTVEKSENITEAHLQYLKDVFLELYPNDFIKKYFPFKILLAKSFTYFSEVTWSDENGAGIAGNSFVLIGKLDENIEDMTAEEKTANMAEINANFFRLFEKNGRFIVPVKFHNLVAANYNRGPYILKEGQTMEDIGFVWMNKSWGQFPSFELDFVKFMEYIFSHTNEQMDELCDNHSLIKQRYELLIKAIKEQMDLDIRTILK